jgi:DNA mismatch repair protein MutL
MSAVESFPEIRPLPSHVANQIAAGEVVERPAAVVKELVENSIDAGATRIEVAYAAGGRQWIRVHDNGRGMSPQECHQALQRHGTSKLRTAEDLSQLHTLGFRGEALPSIASVSRFTLQSRRIDQPLGVEITLNGGKIVQEQQQGMAVGTRIEVAQLFNSVPARRKFLKSDSTEAAHILQLIRLLSLSQPKVSFELKEGTRTLLKSAPCPDLRSRISEVWGSELGDSLIELPETGQGDASLSGFLAPPETSRSTRRDVATLVNGRPVDSRTLNFAVAEACQGYLPKGRYPVAFLKLFVNPAAIDVNVHPAKREVKFRDEAVVRRLVLQSLGAALQAHAQQFRGAGSVRAETAQAALTQVDQPSPAAPAAQPSSNPADARPKSAYPITQPGPVSEAFKKAYLQPLEALVQKRHKQQRKPLPQPTIVPAQADTAYPKLGATQTTQPLEKERKASQPKQATADWRFVASVRGRYALLETELGLMLLHPTAARRRIRFEQIQQVRRQEALQLQGLLFPLTFQVDAMTDARLKPWLPLLTSSGLELEPFGRHCYRLSAHPAWLPEEALSPLVERWLEDIRTGRLTHKNPDLAREHLALLAARQVQEPTKAHSDTQLQLITQQLRLCETPHRCPLGKPTLIELSDAELARRFGL